MKYRIVEKDDGKFYIQYKLLFFWHTETYGCKSLTVAYESIARYKTLDAERKQKHKIVKIIRDVR